MGDRTTSRWSKKSGTSLILAFFMILTLSVLGSSIFLRSIAEGRLSQRYYASSQAFWLADAGIQRSLWELNYNSCAGFISSTSVACTSCSCGAGSKTLAASITGGDYDLTLNSTNTSVTAVGSYPSRSATNKTTRSVSVTLGGAALYAYGIYAKGAIDINNNALVDSYNSGSGSYGGANIATNGSVGTNDTTSNAIDIGNNATIKGNVSTGSGGTIDAGSGVTITGTQTSTNNRTLSSVTVPSSLTGLTSSGALTLSNNGSTVITAGSYKYSNISTGNNCTITISGNVSLYLTSTSSALSTGNNMTFTITSGSNLTLYTDGRLDFSNNSIANANATPSSFQIYSTYSSSSGSAGVEFDNNGTVYAAVYAPDTDVDLNNNVTFYGAVVGRTVDLANNVNFHYDEALSSITTSGSSYSASNWQEI